MSVQLVTANLGWCGPSEKPRSPEAWARAVAERSTDLVFIQEAPSREWLADAFSESYSLHQPAALAYDQTWCRSAVAVRQEQIPSRPLELPTAAYHGSYVATCEVDLPVVREVVCVSVHASPSGLRPEDVARWTGDQPAPRSGAGLWDSDLVLAAVAGLVDEGRSVIAAGDWNEARSWDNPPRGGTQGAEFFERVEAAGLIDATYALWGAERATCGRYQDDHIFVTPDLVPMLANADVDTDGSSGSDHHPVSLTLDITAT